MPGVLAIDAVTGYVHRAPRTSREIILEQFYNVHVVNWRFGVVRYRLEPALLVMIGLMLILLVTGAVMQIIRWKNKITS